jgi:hypothetical protein
MNDSLRRSDPSDQSGQYERRRSYICSPTQQVVSDQAPGVTRPRALSKGSR